MILTPDSASILLARLLLILLIIGAMWLLRYAVAWVFSRPLKAVLARAGMDEGDVAVRALVMPPVRLLLLALAIDLSARVLEPAPALLTFALNVSRSLVITAIAVLIFKLISTVVISPRRFRLFTGLMLEEALLPFVRTGFSIFVIAVMLVIILQVWGYDITGLVAGLGLGGLALSLAAQDLLSNLFGFAAVVSDRPFVVGEYIRTPDVEGIVEHVGVRSTRIRQLNQAVVYVPNSKLAAGTVLNWSRLSRRWIDLRVRLQYGTRADQVEAAVAAVRAALEAQPTVDPSTIMVNLIELAESALVLQVRCYVSITDFAAYIAEQEKILLAILRALESSGVTLALPSQVVYYQNAPEEGK
jgi:MscS family membrane protein